MQHVSVRDVFYCFAVGVCCSLGCSQFKLFIMLMRVGCLLCCNWSWFFDND